MPGMRSARSRLLIIRRPRRDSRGEAPGVDERRPAEVICCSHCFLRRSERGVRAVCAPSPSRPRLAVKERVTAVPALGGLAKSSAGDAAGGGP